MNSNFYKIVNKKFSSQLVKDFKLSRKDIKELNNLIKEPYVKPGWDKIVNKFIN